MHPLLATRRLAVLQTQLESLKLALLGSLDTLDGQIRQLHQTTGNDDWLPHLAVISRMRDETAAVDAQSPGSLRALQELSEQLNHLLTATTGQYDVHAAAMNSVEVGDGPLSEP